MRRALLACLAALGGSPALAVEPAEVVRSYADLAEAGYSDARDAAAALAAAVDVLIAAPSAETLAAARAAWKAARIPYMQTEVFRFGNPVVDDWEGRVNSWPLDEGFIDYVDARYGGATDANPLAVLNVIATPRFTVSGREVDATRITPRLLSETLQEADAVETNVATGYHAVEFLLWGQDLNGTGPGAGDRPWTDYAAGAACTGGNCDRRAEYLRVATELLVRDLVYMADQWDADGAARLRLEADPQAALTSILTGMGSLSYGELAGERMRLGLMLNDPEEEQDCFSDNTHMSHWLDGVGIRNVWLGSYTRPDGRVVSGPSLSALVAETDAALDAEMRAALEASVGALTALKEKAEAGMAYDQMLAAGNAEGEALVMGAVNALIAQTKVIEKVSAALQLSPLEIEGSASLDNPGAVFQ